MESESKYVVSATKGSAVVKDASNINDEKLYYALHSREKEGWQKKYVPPLMTVTTYYHPLKVARDSDLNGVSNHFSHCLALLHNITSRVIVYPVLSSLNRTLQYFGQLFNKEGHYYCRPPRHGEEGVDQ